MLQDSKKFTLAALLIFFIVSASFAQESKLPKPTPVQYSWHEQGRIMFITYGPATWEGREYDNRSIPLSRINPTKLNTDQWCRVAKSWGAKEILFVAKHVGGFCWWPTKTTPYNISNTPYKEGKGDVLGQLAASCKKFGLNLGIYVYPGIKVGSAGRVKDPSKQKAYDNTYREQLKEVLTRYGKIKEVWFDGSCMINVKDILEKYAPDAVIFQGPEASIRWAGNENGILSYPAWNSLMEKDLKTGVATEAQSNPNGNAWAPLEADVPLYNHYWFWSPAKAKKRISLNKLLEIYYKSVGYGGVLLLNATPDTTGLIPKADVKLYAEFGKVLKQRFSKPLAKVGNIKGDFAEIDFHKPTVINHAITMEDYRQGERIRLYVIEGYENGVWRKLAQGTAVGRKKIDYFKRVKVTKVRLHVLQAAATPIIRSFSVYYVAGFKPFPDTYHRNWKACGEWNANAFKNGHLQLKVNLTSFIPVPGQYKIKIIPPKNSQQLKLHVESVKLYFQGEPAPPEFLRKINPFEYNIDQTQQVTKETSTKLQLTLSANSDKVGGGVILIKER